MKSKEFLHKYINSHSPVAEEWEGQKVWADYIKNYTDKIQSDNYGTVFGIIKGEQGEIPDDKRYKVGIEAHADEIAWAVSYIDKDGLIYVVRHGGSDSAIASSKKVLIHTRKNGKVPGVFGLQAIHVRKTTDERVPKVENLFIDCGFDNYDSIKNLGIEVGNLVTFDETFSELGNYFCGKSIDNKIGGYIIAEVCKRLKKNNITLTYDLYIINSVQEEMGLHGANLIANQLKLDLALVHDVTHSVSTTPNMSKIKNSNIISGNGPSIEYSNQNHRKVIDYIRDVANNNKIPYQLQMGSQGNDTMSFFRAGTPTAIIASPLKYMHTTVEMVSKKDVKLAIELFYQCLINFKPVSWKYFDF